jgi:hypothetical protein
MIKQLVGALLAALVCTGAHAQLQARDLSGDGVADAFYDVQQDITWLSLTNGPATWVEQASWVAGINAYGVTGWRLPQVYLSSAPVEPVCPNIPCTGYVALESELTSLFAHTGGDLSAFGSVSGLFFTDAYSVGFEIFAQYVNMVTGVSRGTDELAAMDALALGWAVHEGSVGQPITAPVPEPSTYALMLAGLAFVIWVQLAGRPMRRDSPKRLTQPAC